MKPHIHSRNSVRKYGGRVKDYQHIHDFFDSSKATLPDVRHRAILHSAFGIFLLEKVFGVTMVNSDGKTVSIRDLGEDHVKEDLGFIPTVEHWLKNMEIQDWMFGIERGKTTKVIKFDED